MSTLGNKLLVVFNAAYRNGVSLFSNKEVVADAYATPRPNGLKAVTIRFCAQSGVADSIIHAFQTGEACINIEGVQEAA